MNRILFSIGLCFITIFNLSNAHAQGSNMLLEGETLKWRLADGVQTFRFNDIIVKLTPLTIGDDFEMRFDIVKPDAKPLTFKESGPLGNISIARFGEGTKYNIVLSVFSGGTHCCSAVYVVDYSNDAKLINVGNFDGDVLVPKDIDGDGLDELVTYDQNFFMFSSYAAAMPPMKIFTIANGELRDVTKEEHYITAHENYFKMQSNACNNMVKENTGACLGLLGTAALLGVFDSTMQMLDFDSPAEVAEDTMAPYSICNDTACKQPKEFNDEKSAIIYALSLWGYQPSQYSENKDLTAFISRLKGKNFGENVDACMEGPVSLNTVFANNHIIYELSRYEGSCAFENGAIIGNSLVAKAVCKGIGESVWLENHIYNYDGKTLALSSFTSTRFEDIYVSNMGQCRN